MSGNKSGKPEDADFALPGKAKSKVRRTPKKLQKTPKPSEKGPKSDHKKKMTGPYIHVEKDKSNRVLFSVVNHVPSRKLVDDKDPRKNRSIKSAHVRRPSFMNIQKKKFPSVSLSQTNTSIKDATWVCVFCKQGPHYKRLGDLFGPYFIAQETRQATPSSSSQLLIDREIKTESGEGILPSTPEKLSEKRKRSDGNETSNNTPEKRVKQSSSTNCDDTGDLSSSNNCSQEIWFHENCLVWCNGVFMVAKEIRNMDEAIHDSAETVSQYYFGIFRQSDSFSRYVVIVDLKERP